MKKLIVLLILISVSVWGASENLAQREEISKVDKKVNELMKKFKNEKVELIVVGKVVSLETELYKLNPKKDLVRGNRFPVTRVTFEVLEAYKGKKISKEMIVRIPGGRYTTLEGKTYVKFASVMAYPMLDEGDVLLMGLKKLPNGEFKHIFGKDLQIPFNDEIIDQINDDTKEQKLQKLYRNRQYSSEKIEEKVYSINEKFDSKKEFEKKLIKKLNSNLKVNFSKMEVE